MRKMKGGARSKVKSPGGMSGGKFSPGTMGLSSAGRKPKNRKKRRGQQELTHSPAKRAPKRRSRTSYHKERRTNGSFRRASGYVASKAEQERGEKEARTIMDMPKAEYDVLLHKIHKTSKPITPILKFFHKNRMSEKPANPPIFVHSPDSGRSQRWFEIQNNKLYLKLKKDSVLTDTKVESYDISKDISVSRGKTGGFLGKASRDTQANLCISITAPWGTLDLEASSVSERERLVKAFRKRQHGIRA